MQKRLLKSIGTLCCALGMALTVAAGVGTAYATGGKGSLTLICEKDGVTVEGLQWELYHVGVREGDTFVTTGAFSGYPIVIDDFSQDAINLSAATLENIALLDESIDPIATGATDESGRLMFDGLAAGLYLVSGSVLHVDDAVYVPSCMLFEISGDDQSIDLNAYPKIEYHTQSNQEVIYTVKKVWLNEAGEPCAPTTEITVEIYRDLELYETVVLSDENNWTYEWEDFDYYDFRVKEIVIPDGFTVAYESNETQYLIKNTYHPTEETTVTTTSDTETTTTVSTSSLITTATADEWLPQTGQLWWPVIILVLGGLIFIALGCRFLFDRSEE